MCQLHCGLGMEEHLVKNFLDIKLMEINKLVDLNNLRTAPQLSNSQEKRLLEELEANIFNADWITIGIMASSDNKAIEALQSISKKQEGFLSSKYIWQLSSILAITNLLDLLVKDEIKIEISSSNLSLSFIFAEVETLIKGISMQQNNLF